MKLLLDNASIWEEIDGMTFDDYLDKFNPAQCESNYGGHMLLSSLADWIEWMTIVSSTPPWPNVVDAIIDSCGTDEYITKLTGGEYSQIDREDLGEDLRSVIEKRRLVLRGYYPFEFDNRERLVLRKNFNLSNSACVVLLQISMLKSWTSTDKVPLNCYTQLFEFVVEDAFKSAGYDSSIIGTSRGGSFVNNLKRTADELGIVSDSSGVAHSKAAKDEKVDVVAGRFFRDKRKGEAIILIQATCAKDSKWEAKLSNISLSRWRRYFLECLTPTCYLAIPYHASEENATLLTDLDEKRAFLDRIRLVLMLHGKVAIRKDSYEKRYNEMNTYTKQYLS